MSERMRWSERHAPYLRRRDAVLASDVVELDDLLGPARWRTGRLRPDRPSRRGADLAQDLYDLPGPDSGGPVGRLDPLWDSLGLPTVHDVFPYNVM